MMLQGVVPLCRFPLDSLLQSSVRGKKYYPGWRRLFELSDNDQANLTRAKPSVYETWVSEWETAPIPRELKAFDLNRLPEHLSVRGRKCLPVINSGERRPGYQRRLFGMYGVASGVDIGSLFNTAQDVARETELKRRMELNVDEFKKQADVVKQEKLHEQTERMRNITENLKRLPEIMKKFEVAQAKKVVIAKAREDQKKQLLEDARDRFGYYVDSRDPKFLRMVEEQQEEVKLTKKASRKNMKST